ncbi:TA system VapC family ribonuclease toxin [Leptospira wolffii]|uniref:Ribonuclease VapC n=1 Tax=Leptospira wolffii TaxID=409998 RepID=A0ABV5BLD1_9LEPT
MGYLLDVNVLIALTDSNHEFHEAAWEWFLERSSEVWATCPITENGFVRIFGSPKYPNGPGSEEKARELLSQLRLVRGHKFLHDDISISNLSIFPDLRFSLSKNLTDLYLLGLAANHSCKFVSFDAGIPWTQIVGGGKFLKILVGYRSSVNSTGPS